MLVLIVLINVLTET